MIKLINTKHTIIDTIIRDFVKRYNISIPYSQENNIIKGIRTYTYTYYWGNKPFSYSYASFSLSFGENKFNCMTMYDLGGIVSYNDMLGHYGSIDELKDKIIRILDDWAGKYWSKL